MSTVHADRPAPPGRPVPDRHGRLLRWAVALVVVAAVAVGAVVGIRSWWGGSITETLNPGCTVGEYRVDTDQAVVAADLVSVVISRGLPTRAGTLVVTAAIQESKLRNLAAGDGDRDSVGVLQQRPSQGWGTPEQLADPRFAAGAFLDRVVEVPDWQTAPAADVIQAVQISVDGTLYAEHEPEGQALADALDGTAPAGLACTFAAPSQIAPAATVAAQVAAALPVADPVVDGLRIGVPGAGWATAAWFVANADRLGIASVGYAGREWTRSRAWQAAPDPATAGGDRVTATLATG